MHVFDSSKLQLRCRKILVVLLSTQVISTVSLITDGYLPEDGSGHIIAIQHLPDLDSVCAATDKGDVILWNTLTDQARAFYDLKLLSEND